MDKSELMFWLGLIVGAWSFWFGQKLANGPLGDLIELNFRKRGR